jgi:bifunctional UDP-N-acetylglucosamine pyrophosphorylase/glucosamine-1-phosphate N-acetyltransferase
MRRRIIQSFHRNRSAVTEPLHVIVLAAGMGKRMRSALPKVLHPLAGKPLVAHVIDAARTLSPTLMTVVVGHGAAPVQEALAAPDVRFVVQHPPRGTGDAVRIALADAPSDGVALVAIGDIPLVPAASLAGLVGDAREGKLAVLTAKVPDPAGLGRIVRDGKGAVRAIVEERDASADQLAIDEINTGVMAAPAALMKQWVAALTPDNAQGEYYITDIIAMACAQSVPVVARVAADERDVRGINDRAQLAAVERILMARRAEALMRDGVTIVDPVRIDIRGDLRCGQDVRIDVGCVFEGDVTIGEGATIGADRVLRDVSVGARTSIEPFTFLVETSVGADCRNGPYARTRPGTVLDDRVHIGNFVEVKASRMGEGSKANHLAYIGDATVGAGVNYGAGSIVANYDGANKHRTVIRDRASIGSNCVLVAPVEVGEGATIGAGSVIAQDAPSGVLTVARARQVSIEGWQRPVKVKK